MPDPTRPFTPTSDDGHHQQQEDLLARIEAERLIPEWAWTAVTDTLATLRSLPDGWAHVATRYLTQVARRGHTMFAEQTAWQTQMWAEREAPVMRCRCGQPVKADPPYRRHHREVTVAVCTHCGICQVAYDGEEYEGPTLITAH